ncbi:unnamed protein product [Symbiodinium sp. CCMP2592]|nr:unnamed protein product [Symbiodinium sp. CCMP2592]
MSGALVRPLLLAGCLHGVFAECNVYLETETMAGPEECTNDGLADITNPEEKAMAACLHECWASYVITSQPANGTNAAKAMPERSSCSITTTVPIQCNPIELSCTKPFSEFPNACSGKLPFFSIGPIEQDFYLAFYAYSQELGGGKFEKLLATRRILDKNTTCSANYQVRKAHGDNCFGLTTISETTGPAVAPPLPPAIDDMPDSWPKFPPVFPQQPTTTAAPTDDGAFRHFMRVLPWIAGPLALLCAIGGGLLLRRARQTEERRALRSGRSETSSVEIPSVNSLSRA